MRKVALIVLFMSLCQTVSQAQDILAFDKGKYPKADDLMKQIAKQCTLPPEVSLLLEANLRSTVVRVDLDTVNRADNSRWVRIVYEKFETTGGSFPNKGPYFNCVVPQQLSQSGTEAVFCPNCPPG